MLANLTVPAVSAVRAVAAMVGVARSDRKEEWESDSGAIFHMSHTLISRLSEPSSTPAASRPGWT